MKSTGGLPGQVKINAKPPPRLKASNSRGGKGAYINTNDVCSSIATAVALTELSEWAHLYTAVVYRHTTDTVETGPSTAAARHQ